MKNENNTIICQASLDAVNYGFEKKYKSTLNRMENHIASGCRSNAESDFENIITISECKKAINDTKLLLNNESKNILYFCGSWFLNDCLNELSKISEESLLYITGLKFGTIRTLDQFINLVPSIQTTTYVSAEKRNNQNVLSTLNKNGQLLHAWFHSHPIGGKNGTIPSEIDLEHQADLEKGGYSVIGGIFNREGYIRFFTDKLKYEIEVLGKGIEKVDDNLYKIKGF